MRKIMVVLLLPVIILVFTFAHADQDLTGDWILTLSMEGRSSGDMTLFIYEDNTFEMLYPSDYPLDPVKGSWTFDGEILNLRGEKLDMSLRWDEENHQLTGEYEGRTAVMHMGSEPEAETRTYQLGTSVYTVEIPASFTEGERTEEDIRDDMVAYMRSDETLLDFDVYQFTKEGRPEKLAEYAEQEAAEYKAFEVKTGEQINGIDTAWYRAKEIYDGKEYSTLNYLFEDGDQYVEIAFWLDGENAEEEAMAIINSLTFIQRQDP